jgi:hypothetical protein
MRRGAEAHGKRGAREVACNPARTLALLAMGCVWVGTPTLARADDQAAFDRAKNRFDKGLREEAAVAFERMLDATRPPCAREPTPLDDCSLGDASLVERTRELLAATYLALRRPTDADAQLELLLRANPKYTPDPAALPTELLDALSSVRARLRKELELATAAEAERRRLELAAEAARAEAQGRRVAELERMASEVMVENSRWLALVPFGVGQAQNGNAGLAMFFGVAEGLAAGTSLALAVSVQALGAGPRPADPVGTNRVLRELTVANQLAFGVFGALAVAGVVQAQLAFVERRPSGTRRALPPAVTLAPLLTADTGGAWAGVAGTF